MRTSRRLVALFALPLLLGSGCTTLLRELRESEAMHRGRGSGPTWEQLGHPSLVEMCTTRTAGAGCGATSAFLGTQAQGTAAAMSIRGSLF